MVRITSCSKTSSEDSDDDVFEVDLEIEPTSPITANSLPANGENKDMVPRPKVPGWYKKLHRHLTASSKNVLSRLSGWCLQLLTILSLYRAHRWKRYTPFLRGFAQSLCLSELFCVCELVQGQAIHI